MAVQSICLPSRVYLRSAVDLDQVARGAHATQAWAKSHMNPSSFLFCNESAIVKSSHSYSPKRLVAKDLNRMPCAH